MSSTSACIIPKAVFIFLCRLISVSPFFPTSCSVPKVRPDPVDRHFDSSIVICHHLSIVLFPSFYALEIYGRSYLAMCIAIHIDKPRTLPRQTNKCQNLFCHLFPLTQVFGLLLKMYYLGTYVSCGIFEEKVTRDVRVRPVG